MKQKKQYIAPAITCEAVLVRVLSDTMSNGITDNTGNTKPQHPDSEKDDGSQNPSKDHHFSLWDESEEWDTL